MKNFISELVAQNSFLKIGVAHNNVTRETIVSLLAERFINLSRVKV